MDPRPSGGRPQGQRWWIPVALALGLLVTGGELWAHPKPGWPLLEANTPQSLEINRRRRPSASAAACLCAAWMPPTRTQRCSSGLTSSQPYKHAAVEGCRLPPPRHALPLWARVSTARSGCVHLRPTPTARGVDADPDRKPTSQASRPHVSLEALDAPRQRTPTGPLFCSSTI